MKRAITVLAVTCAAATSVGAATTASADALPRRCSSGHQIDATSYITFHRQTAASVKQYAGFCGGPRNWAYVWIWDSFRASHRVRTSAGVFDWTVGEAVRGWVQSRKGQEILSRPAATIRHCTSATAIVEVGGPRSYVERVGVTTAKRC